MESTTTICPQVPGDSSCSAGVDGRRLSTGVRGEVNLRARSINRQTTSAKTLKDSDNLNILTYNVRTLMREERLIELENALKDIKWDIIGLAEVRRLGEVTEETNDAVFFHFGETQGLHGVGFLVAKKWKDNIIEFRGYSERIAVLKFRITSRKTLTLVQTYAPTSTSSDEDVEDFYDILNRACDENRGTWNIVLGDFNAKVGPRRELDYDGILGLHGLGERNERGTRLLQFAFAQSMHIGNSLFPKKPQRRWTWISPNNQIKNEIDYILTSDTQIIKDVAVINQIKFNSDHRPLRAKIRFSFKIHRAKSFRTPIKNLTRETLFNDSEKFNTELSNHFKGLNLDASDVEEQYNKIVEGIRKCSNRIETKKKKNSQLSSLTKEQIEERSKHNIGSEQRRVLDKQVKRSIRRDIRNLTTHKVKIALEKNQSLRAAKQGICKTRKWINSLQDTNGIKHHNRDKILEICTDYYKNLYSDPTNTNTETVYECPDPDKIPFITGYEVKKVLTSMHYEKSPGEDGVTTEALKLGSPTLLPHITNMFNSILQTGKMPVKMCHSNIILLHKKGDKSDINNYRPISLVSHLYKAFIKVIHNRIDTILDSHQPPEQAGFRPSFSTTDHLHALNQIMEKHLEFGKPLYLAFVDYTKAFDSVKHSAIFSSLQNQQLDQTYINILKVIYNNSTANIKLNFPGQNFKIHKGVKQGDPLSPKLFTSTLEEVFKNLTDLWSRKGITVGCKKLTNLRFADDIIIFAPTAAELQQMLQNLSTASLDVGLMMNRSKTKVMTNSTKSRVDVDGQEIHYVDEYIYLGQLVSFENRQDREIDRRVENAWKSYWSMKSLMKGDLPLSLKRKLIDMCILPILTYGAQTWSLTESQKSKLKVCQRAMERSILGIKLSDRIRNTAIRSKTGIADVGNKTARLKWDWAGHVYRMHQDRWARVVTQWVPEDGRRRRGRPKKRWRDDLDAYLRDWPEKTARREEWKAMGEAFAQQWDNSG